MLMVKLQRGNRHGIKNLNAFCSYDDAHSDYTQEELADYLGVGSSTIGRTLAKIGYSRKKEPNLCGRKQKNA